MTHPPQQDPKLRLEAYRQARDSEDNEALQAAEAAIVNAARAAPALVARLAIRNRFADLLALPDPDSDQIKQAEAEALADMVRLNRHAPEAVVASPANVSGPAPFSITDRWNIPAPPARAWTVPLWIPAGRVTLMTGEGGAGKTRLALMLAAARASGARRWTAYETGPELDGLPEPVIFASWEDDREEFQRRLYDWPAVSGNAPEALGRLLGENFAYLDMAAAGPIWTAGRFDGEAGQLTETGAALRAEAERRGTRLLILDPLAAAFSGNENDRGQVRQFMADWGAWAYEWNCAVVIVSHPPKNTGAVYSGSTDWRNAARAVLVLDHVDGCTRLSCDKSSLGPKPEPLVLRDWTWWSASPWNEDDQDDQLTRLILGALASKPLNKTEVASTIHRKARDVRQAMDALAEAGRIQLGKDRKFHVVVNPSQGSDG